MTSRELAALAGVSQSTVSRVLNGSSGVSERKRQRVLEMARKYQFELDVNARNLKTKKLKRVGVLLSSNFIGFDINLFWATIYSQLHIELQKRGYAAVPVYGYDCSEKIVLNRLIGQKQTDRIILVSTNGFYDETDLEILFQKEIPFVCIYDRSDDDSYYPGHNINVIALDFKKAGRIAGEFLYRKGHRKIALQMCSGNRSGMSRGKGFCESLEAMPEACQIEELSEVSGCNPVTFQGGYLTADANMDVLKECTAVFAVNDAAAMGMIAALQKHGRKVPGDISVIGINDIPMCTWWDPQLTTVSFDVQSMTQRACDILTLGLGGGQTVISPKLVVRDSVISPERNNDL